MSASSWSGSWPITPCTTCARPKASSAWATSTPPQRLDAACRRALEVGDPSYRTVKGILAVGADQQPASAADDSVVSAVTPAHLHGPQTLFAHLDDLDQDGVTDGVTGFGEGVGAVGA